MMKRISHIFLVLSVSVSFLACDGSIPRGRIRVKNDSEDSSYNVLRVSALGASYTLKPGEFALLPKGATNIYLSREYKEFTRTYQVECPPMKSTSSGFQIKLLDAHLNRLAGGCKTVNAAKE